jgi:hypothetical protein
MSELAPPRGGACLPRVSARFLAGCAALALAAAALFWSPLLVGGAISGHDWSSHHFHYFDWVRTSFLGYRTFPLYMADAWITPNFLANAESPGASPLAWLLLVLPTGTYLKLLVVLYTAAGLLGTFLLLRDLEVSAPVASLMAALFAWNGFFVAHVAIGHHWAMGALLLPALLMLFRRAALGSRSALVGAVVLDAATILAGQHQPFLWQNLVIALFALLFALRVRALFPLACLARLLVATFGLAAVKLVPLLFEFAGYAPTARTGGLPLASLLPALVAGGRGPDFGSMPSTWVRWAPPASPSGSCSRGAAGRSWPSGACSSPSPSSGCRTCAHRGAGSRTSRCGAASGALRASCFRRSSPPPSSRAWGSSARWRLRARAGPGGRWPSLPS